MTGVANPSGAPDTFSYAADDMRRQKVTSAGTVGFVWDQQNVLQETDGTGATKAEYTLFPGIWGGLASQRRSGTSSFYGIDQQSNSRFLMSADCTITDQYSYQSFGECIVVSGTTPSSYRYGGIVGYYSDTEMCLYIRMRYLQVSLGRWLR